MAHKRALNCTNCGKAGHEFKQCHGPITSWGIILVDCGIMDRPHYDSDKLLYLDINNTDNIEIMNMQEQSIASLAFSQIKFLMISRKHSLGYIEFIRGRYRPLMIDQTIYLFRQMKQEEIDKIKTSLEMENGFDYLWNDMWGTHPTYHLTKEKYESQKKYEELKLAYVNGPDVSLEFIVNNIKPDYDTDEWGFPKGRRNRDETDEECAIREFKEESGYTDNDFKIVHEIKPINETFIGTNGVKYCHMYYVAEFTGNTAPRNNITEQQCGEVGAIDFFDFNTAINKIRDYHTERRSIVKNLFIYYVKKIISTHRIKMQSSV